MDTNQKVRKARVIAEVSGGYLGVGEEVRVVSGLATFPYYAPDVSTSETYYLVTVDPEQGFVDAETTEDEAAVAAWECGTTVWAEPQALEFLDEEDA